MTKVLNTLDNRQAIAANRAPTPTPRRRSDASSRNGRQMNASLLRTAWLVIFATPPSGVQKHRARSRPFTNPTDQSKALPGGSVFTEHSSDESIF